MVEARGITESVTFVRGELRRIIESETSSFRARLFREELARLDTFERAVRERASRFARSGLADVLETVARYTLDSVESWPEGESIITLDGNKTCARLSMVFDVARRLKG